MIFTKRRFFFNIARLILEPWPDIDELKNKFHIIYILSYDKKDLPGFTVKEKDTPVIYLNKTLEEIFRNFNSTTRNEVRKTLNGKIPGLSFVSEDENIRDSYELSAKFERSQGRRPDSISDYMGCKFFSAYLNNDLISSIACFDNGKVLRAKVICSKRLETGDRELYKIISYATRRLVYEICKYGLENNYDLFDLGSVNFKKENLAKFKMGFTKDLIKEYSYTYRNKLLNKIERFRKLFLK